MQKRKTCKSHRNHLSSFTFLLLCRYLMFYHHVGRCRCPARRMNTAAVFAALLVLSISVRWNGVNLMRQILGLLVLMVSPSASLESKCADSLRILSHSSKPPETRSFDARACMTFWPFSSHTFPAKQGSDRLREWEKRWLWAGWLPGAAEQPGWKQQRERSDDRMALMGQKVGRRRRFWAGGWQSGTWKKKMHTKREEKTIWE